MSFVLFVLVILAFRWSFADQYRVPTGSMIPTVHIGDHIFVDKMAYDLKIPFFEKTLVKLAEPQRGDVVVFLFPEDNSTVYLKRMIGLPGDHIQIENGFITVNGLPVEGSSEGQLKLSSEQSEFIYNEKWGDKTIKVQRIPQFAKNENFDFIVPENKYFCMGDNRDNSSDGRVWGFVPRENLKGKAHFVIWSITFDSFIPNIDISRISQPLI